MSVLFSCQVMPDSLQLPGTTHEILHRLAVRTFPQHSGIFKRGHQDMAMNSDTRPGGFPGGRMMKNLPANAGDLRDSGLIPVGKIPGGWRGNPLQYSCLENPMDRGAWWAPVHGVTKSRTRLKPLSTHTCTRSGLSPDLGNATLRL